MLDNLRKQVKDFPVASEEFYACGIERVFEYTERCLAPKYSNISLFQNCYAQLCTQAKEVIE